jgi:AraC-like DNA-binding protein
MPKRADPISPLSFRHPDDDRIGIEALSIGQLRQRASLAILSRITRADFYRMILITSGQTNPWIDFHPITALSNDCLLVKPGQVFRHDFSRSWDGLMVVFRPERLLWISNSPALATHMDRLPDHCSLSPTALSDVSTAMRNMQRDSLEVSDLPTRQSLLQLQLSYALMRLCLVQTAGLHPGPSSSRALAHYERFKSQLEKDFGQHHQVQHFGTTLGLSFKSLNRACLEATGQSTKSCINQRIALEAKRLLAHTALAVQVIASDLGFEDPTNFVKFFKREVGLTPGQFRASQSFVD